VEKMGGERVKTSGGVSGTYSGAGSLGLFKNPQEKGDVGRQWGGRKACLVKETEIVTPSPKGDGNRMQTKKRWFTQPGEKKTLKRLDWEGHIQEKKLTLLGAGEGLTAMGRGRGRLV